MAKKKQKKLFGVYYTQGKLSKKDKEWICHMLENGITVYHQYGAPHCGPNGCS